LDAGFAAAGIARAGRAERAGFFEQWIESGRHGSMAWMADHVDVRVDTTELLPDARSVLCVADRYPGGPDAANAGLGRIARYARGRDYHKGMKKRLHALCDTFKARWPEHEFRACVDTAPVLEREVAEAAGIGAVGKNTMLIQQGVGSWILLGEIVTTLEIEPNATVPTDPCGTCTRCIDACPTDALSPFAMDATRCISYLTIEHRDVIDRTLHAGMGAWIFGCDICQEVCPHNQQTTRTVEAPVEPSSGSRAGALALLDVLDWSAEDRIAAVGGTSATRAKLDMWRRNAAIALRNGGPDAATAARLDAIAADTSEVEMVRDAATR